MEFRKFSYCPLNRPYNRRPTSFGASDSSNRIIIGMDKGERVALKRIHFNSGENGDESERYWENLLKLRDDNLVQYRSFSLQDDGRYLVMEICHGSLLEYCRGTLDNTVASLVSAIDVMWPITCAVDYLYSQKIGHGDLKLENVLFLKTDWEPKRVIVKLSGYGYSYLRSRDNVKTDFFQLGCLYFSAASKKEIKPNEYVAAWNLTEISANARPLALELINLVTDAPFSLETGTLLRHPFFICYCQYALPRLIKQHAIESIGRKLNNPRNLQKWKKTLDNSQLPNENFSDLERILLSDEKSLETSVIEAGKTTPQLLSQYVWHLSTTSTAMPRGNNKSSYLEKVETLGEGSYGTVFKCHYTNQNGQRFLAAGKQFRIKPGVDEMFQREIDTLSKLKHLFVIEYLDVVKMNAKKYIVMELCEGSLKQYVEGELAQIPKDSLDDKIVISQVALGMAYIHSKGIVHKDLKLENILLKRQSPESPVVLAKIADFGLAKELKADSAEFSVTKHPGTETYMAPELLRAPMGAYPATFASDIYALGITIARIVSKGDHPFTSQKYRRSVCMVKGLVPPSLEHLTWDLIDLIIKLMDKDPAKRPSMVLVLRHPYFVLTNDRTIRHFTDQLWNDLNSQEDKNDQMNNMFNSHNFEQWYDTLIADKPETAEELEEMEETFVMLRKIGSDCTVESLYPAKQYKRTIKNALKEQYDANIGNQINQILSEHVLLDRNHSQSRAIFTPRLVFQNEMWEKDANYTTQINQSSSMQYLQNHLSRNRVHKMVQRKPVLLVSYFWSCLVNMVNSSSVNSSVTSQPKLISSGEKKHQLTPFKHWITSELEWSSLYYDDDEEIADELWKMKYRGTYDTCQETKGEIIQTATKCNISPGVWSELLNSMGTDASALLREVVQSHVPNAPNITEMIVQKHWIKEEKLTSLHLVAFNEGDWAVDIMEVLLNNSRNPKAVTEDGLTPAHIAAQNESSSGPRLMKLLLDNGANSNARFQDGTTPVHWAAMNQGKYAADILKYLLRHGGDSERTGENSLKPIHYATMNTGDSVLKLLDLLLQKRGANKADSTGRTLLHFAVLNEGNCGHMVVEKLLENGENPNAEDNEKRTPLHFAARDEKNRQNAIMQILLRNRSDPNAVDQFGRTPVHYAAANKGEYAHEKLNLLLFRKGNLTIKDKNGLTPVHCTIINNGKCGEAMRKLVNVNPEKINAYLNSNGETLLHHLVSEADGQLELVQMVLDSGGNPNATDSRGRSPVHSVVMLNESLMGLDMLRLLITKGGNANLRDKEKQWTSVHYVASSLKLRVPEKMKILLCSGADVNAQGNDGTTPLHLAVANSVYGPHLTRMLLKFKVNPDATGCQQRTPLHNAVKNENDDISLDAIVQLLEKGANPNARDCKGLTPVHYAVQHKRRNSVKVVKILLQHGGSMTVEDNKGMTPHCLAEYCLPECLTAYKI